MSRAVVFVAETLRMAAPYAACGLAAVVTERAGVVNVALEGVLIISGLGATAGAVASGSAVVGLVTGLIAGAAFSALHGVLVVKGRVDAIVSGIALNVIAYGFARVLLRVLYDSASNSPKVPGFGLELASPIARVLVDPVVLLLAVTFGLVPVMLGRTRFGLHLRASGEGPDAARAAGVDVARVRIVASTLAGAIAAIGGAHLVFDQRHFDAGMSGGRGFIALAAVILGGWRPGPAALACLGFAALEATQIALQDAVKIPPELVQMLPYLATLLVLALARRTRAPAGIGLPLQSAKFTSHLRRLPSSTAADWHFPQVRVIESLRALPSGLVPRTRRPPPFGHAHAFRRLRYQRGLR